MKNETPDTIYVRNFNEVTLHHNSEWKSFFAASDELAVPAGGQSSTTTVSMKTQGAERWHI